MTATLAFAFAAGMLSTVNPCGFALLPAYLAHLLGATPQPAGPAGRALAARLAVGLRGGITVAAGFAAVYTLAGLLVAAGLRTLIEVVPAVAVGLGVVLILLGMARLTGRSLPLPQRLRSAGPTTRAPGSLAAFGVAYAVASLSCTLAVLLAVVGQALATANLAALFAVFAAYAAGAASLITALAVTTVLASSALTSLVRRLIPAIGRLSGAALGLAGVWLLAYWAPALHGSTPSPALTGAVGPLATAATGWLQAHQSAVAVVAVVVVGAAATLAAARRRQASSTRYHGSSSDCCSPPEVVAAPGGPPQPTGDVHKPPQARAGQARAGRE